MEDFLVGGLDWIKNNLAISLFVISNFGLVPKDDDEPVWFFRSMPYRVTRFFGLHLSLKQLKYALGFWFLHLLVINFVPYNTFLYVSVILAGHALPWFLRYALLGPLYTLYLLLTPDKG